MHHTSTSGFIGDHSGLNGSSYIYLNVISFQAVVATIATQPVDVLKTRLMNARPGEYTSILQCLLYTAKTGPLGFFKVNIKV